MAATKKTATAAVKAEAVKAEAPKAEAVVKEAVKEEAPKAEAKATVKKAAAKKAEPAKKEAKETKKAPAKKAAAKKCELKTQMEIQLGEGKSYTQEDLVKIAKDVWKFDLKQKASDLTSIELYVKPEEGLAYYVMNTEFTGSFAI